MSGSGFLSSDARKVSPSEEVLAMWVLKRRRRLKRKRVLELGAGCGLAGLTVASCTSAKHVEITDGDPNAVAMIEGSIGLNTDHFSAKKVCKRQLVWGDCAESLKPFDLILAADVLEGDSSALLNAMKRLLKPTGTVIMFASPNNGCLNTFVSAAKPIFDRIEVSKHYDEDVTKALHGMTCFPRMVRMERSNAFVPKAAAACVDACAVASLPSSAQLCPTPVQPQQCTDDLDTPAVLDTSAANNDRVPSKGQHRRHVLALRAQRRSCPRAASTHVSPDPAENGDVTHSDMATGTDAASIGTSRDSRLPSLQRSRSNSAKSVRVAAEVSPLALGATRHSLDNNAASIAAGTTCGAFAPGYPSACSTASISRSATAVSPEISIVVPSFWSQLPDGGAGNASIGNPGLGRIGRRCSSVPPAGKGKPADCLLGLAVDGNAIPIQRCSGVPAARGKMRSARGMFCEPLRIPAVCA